MNEAVCALFFLVLATVINHVELFSPSREAKYLASILGNELELTGTQLVQSGEEIFSHQDILHRGLLTSIVK